MRYMSANENHLAMSAEAALQKVVKLLALSLVITFTLGCQTNRKFACPPVNPDDRPTSRWGATPLPSN
jgi:hypothetical protein